MKNLAGNTDADKYIRNELERARIPIEPAEPHVQEVPYTIQGRLGGFEFTRAWYYWVVSGNVPIVVAEELYADPVGVKDIRVAGHCGCPPPAEWSYWFTADGKKVLTLKDEAEFKDYAERHEFMRVAHEQNLYSDDPASLGAQQFVTSYHIDSELGLRIFADALKAHGLVQEPVTG